MVGTINVLLTLFQLLTICFCMSCFFLLDSKSLPFVMMMLHGFLGSLNEAVSKFDLIFLIVLTLVPLGIYIFPQSQLSLRKNKENIFTSIFCT